MARRLKKLVVREISGVDRAANPGAKIILRKRADPGAITIRKGAEVWTLPADHDGPRETIIELARKQGYTVEGDAIMPGQKEQRMSKRKEIVAIAKQFAETGEVSVEIQKRDVYAALLKGAEKIRQPGETSEQAFSRYATTSAEGQNLFRLHKSAPGPDWAPSPTPTFETGSARLAWERQEGIRKAASAAGDRERAAERAIDDIARAWLATGQYRTYEAARAAAERSPKIRSMRSAASIYRTALAG
jgi:hypothetical protein